jgi:hypothetical protein
LADWTAVSGSDDWQADGGIIAQRRDGFLAHVASTLHSPFIVLFEQQGAGETDGGNLVGEDYGFIGTNMAVFRQTEYKRWFLIFSPRKLLNTRPSRRPTTRLRPHDPKVRCGPSSHGRCHHTIGLLAPSCRNFLSTSSLAARLRGSAVEQIVL